MRFLGASVFSVIVTLALFFMMRFLIVGEPYVIEAKVEPTVELVRIEPPDPDREPDEPVDEKRFERPQDPDSVVGLDREVVSEAKKVKFPGPSKGIPGRGEFHITDGDPIPVSTIPPNFPGDAVRSGIEGWVLVEFRIGADGSVSDAKVLDAEPRRGLFDDAALRAVAQWRFRPRIENGVPVPARARYTIDFSMND